MIAYKLFRKMKDGSLAPLFINKKQRLYLGWWYEAEDHPTKGYAHRPGWHSCNRPNAPHLSEKGRVWCEVAIRDVKIEERPRHQGGNWFLSNHLMITKELSDEDIRNIISKPKRHRLCPN